MVCDDVRVVADEEWLRIRSGLRFGQRLRGPAVRVPRLGAIGVFVDVGLPIGGFVDGLLLPRESDRWPAEGTETEFEVWWADERAQIRLKPVDTRFLRKDFAEYLRRWRPGWSNEQGIPVDDQG